MMITRLSTRLPQVANKTLRQIHRWQVSLPTAWALPSITCRYIHATTVVYHDATEVKPTEDMVKPTEEVMRFGLHL